MSNPTKRVGIRDVAKACGLSITTVSWALNGKGEVAQATRERVQKIAEQMGYRPNEAARALQSGRSRIIGIAVAHRESGPWRETYLPYYRSIIAGAAIEAVEHGHAVAAIPFGPKGLIEAAVPFDGLVVVDPTRNDPILAECHRRGIPVVTDGRPMDQGYEDVLVVDNDIKAGITMVLDHGAAHGVHQPALLSGTERDSFTLDTERYYRAWCRRNARKPIVRKVRSGVSPLDAARHLLTGSGATIDGIHGLNETYGMAVLAVAAEKGIRVPDDLLVTMMGEPNAMSAGNGASYLAFDPVSSGAACVRLLIAKLEGRPTQNVLLPGRFVASST